MLSKLISSIGQRSIKSILKLDDKVEEISKKFENSCPPKEELKKIIIQKNTFISILTTIKTSLNGITKTGQTLSGIITGLEVAVKVIKYLPVPIAPFTPLTVTNVLADSLDTLGGLLTNGKGTVKMIPQVFKSILLEIDKLIIKLNLLDIALNSCIKSQGISQNELTESLTIDNPSDVNQNQTPNEDLLNQLQPGSLNPLFYKGFKLEIQYDPKNEFSFSSRRIKVQNSERSEIIFYNLTSGGYSFSSTVDVLIDEAKFEIDSYYNRITGSIVEEVEEVEEVKEKRKSFFRAADKAFNKFKEDNKLKLKQLTENQVKKDKVESKENQIKERRRTVRRGGR